MTYDIRHALIAADPQEPPVDHDDWNGAHIFALDLPCTAPGNWILPDFNEGATQAATANRLYLSPLWVPKAVTLSDLGIRLSVGQAGNVRMGIFTYAAGTFTHERSVGTPPSTGSGAIITAALSSNYAAAAGVIWLGALFDAAPTYVSWASTEAGGGGFQKYSGSDATPTSNEVSGGSGIATMYVARTYSLDFPATQVLSGLTYSSSHMSPILFARVAP